MKTIQFSVVSTLYRSAEHLTEFHRRMSASAAALTAEYEIILVNDGSPDECQALAQRLCEEDPRTSLIELSRNFGHHLAIMTGLAHARGQRTFLLDCDLEEEPEWLELFAREMERTSADVVYGVQANRRGRGVERAAGALFYWLINRLSPHPIPSNLVTARLMRRSYVRSLVAHRDREPFLAGLWVLTGFRQVAVAVVKGSHSRTSYDLRRRIVAFVNALTNFTTTPLAVIFYLGTVVCVGAGAAGLLLILRRLFFGPLLGGWASLIVSIWFIGGLSIFSLGVIGMYLAKVFAEVKERPYTVIRSIHGALADRQDDDRGPGLYADGGNE